MNNRVIGLNLYNCGLKKIPIEAFSLSKLERLGFRENKIRELSDKISSLTCLVELEASKNRIGKITEKIGRLAKLERLFLCHNKLSELPLELEGLKSLTTLCLESNNLRTLPATFIDLEKLEELDLSNNNFKSFPDRLPSKIWMLHLSRNKISKFPSRLDLPSFDYLSLSGNKLSELQSSLDGLKSLKGLYLRQNRFTEVPKALIDLEQILDFDLSDNPLEKLPLWSILINGFKHNTSLDLVSDYSTFTKRFLTLN